MEEKKLKQGGFISAFLKFGFIFDEMTKLIKDIDSSIHGFCYRCLETTDPSFIKYINFRKQLECTDIYPSLINKLEKSYASKIERKNVIADIANIMWHNGVSCNTFYEIANKELDKGYLYASQRCESFGNFSNTCMFRNFTIENRKISIINKRINNLDHKILTDRTKEFNEFINFIYYLLFLKKNVNLQKSIVGFVSGKSYIEHAKVHLGCRSAISIDISKFYDNTTLYNILSKGLFYKVLLAAFKNLFGVEFKEENFDNKDAFELLGRLFGVMNVQFITLMNFFTHNGRLPTGMPYSPSISNLLFAPIDIQIIKNLEKTKTYSRYADDICISTKEEKDIDGNFTINIEDAKNIERLIGNNGYHLKYSKTKIMGPRDKKVIAGIILGDSSDGQKLSIGTQRKIQLAEEYKDKCWNNSLTNHDRGVLEWVRNINFSQYSFIIRDIRNVPENKKLPVVPKDRKIDSLYLRENFDSTVLRYKMMLSR